MYAQFPRLRNWAKVLQVFRIVTISKNHRIKKHITGNNIPQTFIIDLTIHWISFQFLFSSDIEWMFSSSKEVFSDHLDGKSSEVLNRCERDPECQAYQYYKVGSLFYGVLNLVVELEYPGLSVCIKPKGRRVKGKPPKRNPKSKSDSIQNNISETVYFFLFIMIRWCVNILEQTFRIQYDFNFYNVTNSSIPYYNTRYNSFRSLKFKNLLNSRNVQRNNPFIFVFVMYIIFRLIHIWRLIHYF